MICQIKVLIGDDSIEYGVSYASTLRKMGMYAITRPKDGDALFEAIKKIRPDVAVVDAVLPNMDAIDIIRNIRKIKDINTKFIVTSAYDNSFIEKEVMESGASYYMLKPLNITSLGERINAIVNGPNIDNFENSEDVESVVTKLLHNLGMPVHIKGYHYMRKAIVMSFENPKLLRSITKVLYPAVAEVYDTTSSRVERSLRHAIEVTWERGNTDAINSLFANALTAGRGKVTNSEFIALITDKLRYQYYRKSEIKQINL